MSYFKDENAGCGYLLITISIILSFFTIGWFSHSKVNREIVSKVELTPEIRLIVDGKRIDTLYIYKTMKKE